MSNRYDDMSEAARQLMSDLDHIDLAEECASALRDGKQAEAEVMRLRAGEEPVTDPHAECTPGQWLWHWNRLAPEQRLERVAQIQDAMARSGHCFMGDHDERLEETRAELDRLRREVEEQAEAKEVYIRVANSAGAARDRLADVLREVLAVFTTVTITGDDTPLGHLAPGPARPDDFSRWRAALDEQPAHEETEPQPDGEGSGPVCRYCGADCSNGRSCDGSGLYACTRCANARAAIRRFGGDFDRLAAVSPDLSVLIAEAESLPHPKEQPAHEPGTAAGRDCLMAHGGGRPCLASDRCATCDPKEQ